MRGTSVRTTAALTLVVLPVIALVAARIAAPDLPARVPTHWAQSYPDDYASTTAMWTTVIVIAAVAAAAGVLGTLLGSNLSRAALRWIVGVTAGVSGTAAAAWLGAVVGTEVSGGAPDVHVIWALGPLVVGALWGVLAAWTYGKPADVADGRADGNTTIVPEPLSVGAAETWESDISSVLMGALAGITTVVFAVMTAVMVLDGAGVVVATVLVFLGVGTGVLVAGLARARLTVTRAGLQLRSRLVPVTFKRIPLDRIAQVVVEPIHPSKWGGIGYRVMPGRSAYVVHGGPGLVIDLTDGRRFAVEITAGESEAVEGAAVLKALVANHLEHPDHSVVRPLTPGPG